MTSKNNARSSSNSNNYSVRASHSRSYSNATSNKRRERDRDRGRDRYYQSSRPEHRFDDYDTASTLCRDDKCMQTVHKYGGPKYGNYRKISCLEWNCDGHYLASGCVANNINIYKTDDKSLLKDSNPVFQLNQSLKGAITGLSWHPKNSGVLSAASEDATVHLWNVSKFSQSSNSSNSSCKPFHIIKTGNCLTGIEWSNGNGDQLAISDKENTITLVDGHKYTEITKKKLDHRFHAFKWSVNNKYLIIGTKDGTLELLDTRSSKNLSFVHSFPVHNSSCFCIDLNSETIVTGGADAIVTIIEIESLTQLFGLPLFETPVQQCVIHPSNKHMIASCGENEMEIDCSWAHNGQNICKIQTQFPVTCLSWHPSKHLLAYSTNNDTGNINQDLNTKNIHIWGSLKPYKI